MPVCAIIHFVYYGLTIGIVGFVRVGLDIGLTIVNANTFKYRCGKKMDVFVRRAVTAIAETIRTDGVLLVT
ncbi:hypothetical protein GGI1_22439 [Acidithiobacillus sp. GGI-221]|nr:hypothetical protein GGI1_22439 [Acidithiobacillus sp. GGI-221]